MKYQIHHRIGIIIACIILFTPSLLEANPSVDVPLRHWSYDVIEKLAILDLADIADIGARPVSRIKMAYMIKSAIEKSGEYELEFTWDEQNYLETLLSNLIEEFREELVIIGVEVAAISDSGPKKYIFHSPELNVEEVYTSLDSERARFENKDGWSLRDGFNARIKLTGWAKAADLFALSLTPGLRYSEEDTDIDFENAHIRISPPGFNLELLAGRTSMWWGPGFDGTLLMTDNAFPLDIVKVNNVRPFRLPWILGKLGRFNGQIFVSRLEEKRTIENPYLAGWRVDYTPWDALKFGAGHVLMFGGKGVETLDFSSFLSSFSGVFSPAGGESETENHIISADVQYFIRRIDRFLPLATGCKLYMEYGAEDEEGNSPVKSAIITGAHFTDVFKIPGLDTKVEFAKLNSIWYDHFKYRSGYTHRGNIIGHYLGGDAEGVTVSGIYDFPGSYQMGLTLGYERRGINRANIETTTEIKVDFNVTDGLKLYNIHNVDIKIFYEYNNIDNYNNTSDAAKDHIIVVEANRKF